jgi:hypothetical protein
MRNETNNYLVEQARLLSIFDLLNSPVESQCRDPSRKTVMIRLIGWTILPESRREAGSTPLARRAERDERNVARGHG